MNELTKKNSLVVLIVTFYLSKYDRQACRALGYNNFHQAFEDVGHRLGVKPNTIKNRRDEFDPIHDNGRVGWYQRGLRSSYAKIVQMFDNLSFEALTDLVRDLLNDGGQSLDVEPMLMALNAQGDKQQSVFVPRAATGRKAEECFIRWFHEGVLPFQGKLVDKRDYGCGYDFFVEGHISHQVEVKGLVSETGGVLLTDKEWQTARHYKQNYSLFVVYSVDDNPTWTIINNPSLCLSPKMSVRTVVQVSWQVPSGQLGLLPQTKSEEGLLS